MVANVGFQYLQHRVIQVVKLDTDMKYILSEAFRVDNRRRGDDRCRVARCCQEFEVDVNFDIQYLSRRLLVLGEDVLNRTVIAAELQSGNRDIEYSGRRLTVPHATNLTRNFRVNPQVAPVYPEMLLFSVHPDSTI